MSPRPRPAGPAAASDNQSGTERTGSIRTLIARALSEWSLGDFAGCLQSLDDVGVGRHTSESILLRARALLRLQRAADAENWLRMTESQHIDDDAIATHTMLLGSAHSQLGEFDRAATSFAAVRLAQPHPTILTETAYYEALSLWQIRDYKAARAVLQPAIGARQDIVTARALQLLGFIAIAEQNFAESHRHFEAALESLIRCRALDRHLEATLLHALSIGYAEVDVRDPVELDRMAREFEWTDALVAEHVQTLRHIGLAYARRRQPDTALDRFLEAAAVQSDSPWTIAALSDAATLSLRLNEPVNAGGYLRRCARIAEDLCWEAVAGEARMALLHFATALARSGDGGKARRYLDCYHGRDRLGARLPALSALNFDSRLQSFERHAEGLVRGALGLPDAVPILADVVNEWRRLKYVSRSDEARDDIRALTHRSYHVGGAKQTAHDQNLETAATGTITVTMQQDRIIRQLVQGRTIAEIADDLVLAQKTVRNHLARLYTLFEVSGQSQLVVAILRNPELRRLFLSAVSGFIVYAAAGCCQTG
jgi:DNA-binding CsgD family transcriptional regulator/tetratricopeptide (TPR) repeat protein